MYCFLFCRDMYCLAFLFVVSSLFFNDSLRVMCFYVVRNMHISYILFTLAQRHIIYGFTLFHNNVRNSMWR